MKQIVLYAIIPLLLIFLLLQFVPVARTNPPTLGEIQVPTHIHTILKKACWDCHSHQTQWPWYSRVAPVSWLVAHDVKEGRAELNFSMWTQYNTKKKRKKLEEIEEEVSKQKMPPRIYTWLHAQAILTAQEKEQLRQWVKASLAAISDAPKPSKPGVRVVSPSAPTR